MKIGRYFPSEIERKWQKKWKEEKTYKFKESEKKKYYNLVELPYPSGDLHLGHWFAFVPPDAHARYKKMQGFNVFYPNGFDAFGLPAENAAIKKGVHPKNWTFKNIETMRSQFETMGTMIDWSRSVITCEPEYYKWNQWIFLKMFEKGLAYRGKALSNWCPVDQTVLANEHIEGGKCWRCGAEVIQKEVEQWFLAITKYADDLIWPENPSVDWPRMVREGQNNWIGKSDGMLIKFPVTGDWNYVLLHGFTGSSKGDFFPWIKKELEKDGSKVQVPDLPNTNSAKVEEQADYVLKNLKFDENTVLLGHSLGAPVALKVVERLKKPIRKLVLAAAFAQPGFLDHERLFEKTFNWEFDFEKIRQNAGEVVILRAENDSAVPSERADFIKEKIGGRIVDFKATIDHITGKEEPIVLENLQPSIEVFTTRIDTIFGMTYVVLAPEHPFAQKINTKAVAEYIKKAQKKTEMERKEDRVKSGVFTGNYAINPVNGEKVPIWISDYVLAGYGTGAIMSVPGHDERDFEFAKMHNLPIKEVVIPKVIDKHDPPIKGVKTVFRRAIQVILINPKNGKVLALRWKKFPWTTFITGGVEEGEDIIEAAKREIAEEVGYEDVEYVKTLGGPVESHFYANHKKENRKALFSGLVFHLKSEKRNNISKEEASIHESVWMSWGELDRDKNIKCSEYEIWLDRLSDKPSVFADYGVLINSGKYDGLTSEEAKNELINWFEKENIGKRKVNYHLRDWSVSRQRYWGTPVPIIHCEKCGLVPVPYEDLPVTLPEMQDFTPKGKPPLASDEQWLEVKCPNCSGPAKRDAETLDTFFDSAWYYYRYCSPHFDKAPFDSQKVKELMPIDIYFGGSEHTLGHTLYARFFTRFFKDLGLVEFEEFAKKRSQHGVILGPDGNRMSKSKGNVVNPDQVVKEYGADTVRLYLCFMMPYEATAPWSESAISGVYRFLKRVWELYSLIDDKAKITPKDLFEMHSAIKKVGDDLEMIHFNTAVSSLMIWLNHLSSKESISREEYETFLKILSPFAPHITQELWQLLDPTANDIFLQNWPLYQSKYLMSDSINIVVQVNGKTRGTVEIESTKVKDKSFVEEAAKKSERTQKYLSGIKKVIYIEGKVINFVV